MAAEHQDTTRGGFPWLETGDGTNSPGFQKERDPTGTCGALNTVQMPVQLYKECKTEMRFLIHKVDTEDAEVGATGL